MSFRHRHGSMRMGRSRRASFVGHRTLAEKIKATAFGGVRGCVVKATDSSVAPPKPKHLLNLTLSTNQGQAQEVVRALMRRVGQSSFMRWPQVLKTLTVVHYLLLEGGRPFQDACLGTGGLLHTLYHYVDAHSPHGISYSALIQAYAAYLDSRILTLGMWELARKQNVMLEPEAMLHLLEAAQPLGGDATVGKYKGDKDVTVQLSGKLFRSTPATTAAAKMLFQDISRLLRHMTVRITELTDAALESHSKTRLVKARRDLVQYGKGMEACMPILEIFQEVGLIEAQNIEPLLVDPARSLLAIVEQALSSLQRIGSISVKHSRDHE